MIEKYNNKTVQDVMKHELKFSSRLFTRLKFSGGIRLNGEVCKSIDVVHTDDVLSVDMSDNNASENIVPTKIDVCLVYEDDCLVVVNKSANLPVHPSMGNYENTLANALAYCWKSRGETRIFRAVNRLDKDTTGLCIVAKNQYVHSILSRQIQDKTLKRKYIAVVHGEVDSEIGVINLPIRREKDSIIKRVVADDGDEAVTNYKVLHHTNGYTVLEIELLTGRTHQIRVHFAHMGHPLVGDGLYGHGDNERHIISRHALHSYYLEFIHPMTQERMQFEISPPEDIIKLTAY